MKAAIFNQFGSSDNITISDIEIPSLAKGELLIRVVVAGLNPKDILIRKGKFKRFSGKKFPQQIGFDFAGIVENDNNVNGFKKGDKVFGMLNGWQGKTCAEFVKIKMDELYRMPKNISFEEAAGIPLVAQTALQAIRYKGKLQANQSVCINGASGGVGTVAIQLAKILGGKVTTISSRRNLELCRSLGAAITLDYEKNNIINTDKKFDLFFDVFGNYSFAKCAKILKPKGIYITTVPKPEIFKEQVYNLFRKKKAKMIVVKSNSNDLKWIHDKIQNNQLQPVVDKVFTLNEITAAQKYIESKRARGKVVVSIK